MSSFSVTFRNNEGIRILDLNGELDAHTAAELEAGIQKCIDDNALDIVINGANLRYISSAGLGVFMAFVEEVREKQGDIKIVALQSNVFDIFDLLGFPHLFDINESESEAIELFNNGSRRTA